MKAVWLPPGFLRNTRSVCSIPPRTSCSLPICQALPAKSFSTTRRPSAEVSEIKAAPEIRFSQNKEGSIEKELRINARLVPVSPSYFTASPFFIDALLRVEALFRKHGTLPVVKPSEAPRVSWRTLVEYRNLVGEQIRSSKYQKIIQILQRLNLIHHSLMPADVKAVIEEYKRDIDPQVNSAKPIPIDKFGRACGAGRRKSSTARAWVVEGNGEVLVNGKTLVEAFGRIHDRESAIWPLKATDRIDKYNVWALVEGGGTTGQAEAMTLAVAKALMAHEPLLKPALRRAGCVTRDPRRVERKKAGHLKARKKPAWVKR